MHNTFPRVRQLLKDEVKRLHSVNKVSLATGLTNNTIGKYLEGMSEPKQETLEKLSAYFKRPVAWLRGDTDDPTLPTVDQSAEEIELHAACDILLKLPPAQRKTAIALIEAFVASVSPPA